MLLFTHGKDAHNFHLHELRLDALAMDGQMP